MRLKRIPIVACAGLLLLAFGPQVASPQEPPPETAPAATFVGSETCAGCHDDVEPTLAGTPHGSQYFLEVGVHGCETCHGPGSAHVEDPEAFQPSFDRLTSDEQSAVCQQCHDGKEQFFWEGGVHDDRGLSCLSCHNIHHPQSDDAQLTMAGVADTCYQCHKDVRAEMWKRSHHPVREGQIDCADCHNPHGSQTEAMIREASINDQCYSCHTEKRGPFLWEHAPVRESCMTCHTPHGSNHIKLQKTSVPFLCQQCHANTRHPGTLYDARNLPDGTAPSNRAFNRACLNCHSMVHGSNHPSSPYLGH